MTRVNRWDDCEDQSCENTNRGADNEHAPINLAGIIDHQSWYRRGKCEHKRVTAPVSNRNSTGRSDQRKKKSSGKKLLKNPSSPAAHGQTIGILCPTQQE